MSSDNTYRKSRPKSHIHLHRYLDWRGQSILGQEAIYSHLSPWLLWSKHFGSIIALYSQYHVFIHVCKAILVDTLLDWKYRHNCRNCDRNYPYECFIICFNDTSLLNLLAPLSHFHHCSPIYCVVLSVTFTPGFVAFNVLNDFRLSNDRHWLPSLGLCYLLNDYRYKWMKMMCTACLKRSFNELTEEQAYCTVIVTNEL